MRSTIGTSGRARLLWALLLIIAVPALTLAQHAAKSNGNGKDADTEEAVGVAGQQVAKDPATGKLRQPTREEVKALSQGLQKNLAQPTDLPVSYHEDGTISIYLDEQWENAAIVKLNGDGSISQVCVDNVKDAEKFLTSDQSKTRKPAKSVTNTSALEEK